MWSARWLGTYRSGTGYRRVVVFLGRRHGAARAAGCSSRPCRSGWCSFGPLGSLHDEALQLLPQLGSFRVRIALNLKGLPYEYAVVHLTKDGGQQFIPAFRALNPDALIPVLDDDGRVLTSRWRSSSTWMNPPRTTLLPRDALERAYRCVRSRSALPARSIRSTTCGCCATWWRELGASEDAKNAWYRHWSSRGLPRWRRASCRGPRRAPCAGRAGHVGDVVLVPQIFNARRFECRLDHVPTLMRIFDHCMELALSSRPSRRSNRTPKDDRGHAAQRSGNARSRNRRGQFGDAVA